MPIPTPTTITRHSLRILYADDVRELRELVRLVFARDGHHVDCACDGAEALELFEQRSEGYDLIITDHHMPRMKGLEFAQHLRRLGYAGKLLVFSSELSPSVTCEYLRLGVDRVLHKPIFPNALRELIAELFGPALGGSAAPFATVGSVDTGHAEGA